MGKSFDWSSGSFVGVIVTAILGLIVALFLLSTREQEPATINVRCIGDHLLFESARTGDIQVIPNKCKKTYPKSQAPTTEDK